MGPQVELVQECRRIQRAMERTRTRRSSVVGKRGAASHGREKRSSCGFASPKQSRLSSSSPSGSQSSPRTATSSDSSRDSASSPTTPASSSSPSKDLSISPTAPSFTSSLSSSSSSCVSATNRRCVELIRFFFNDLSSRFVFTGPGAQNGWKRLLLPVAFTNEAFKNAVCAFSSAHLEAMDIVTGKSSVAFHEAALLALTSEVHSTISDVASSLATILVLIQYAALVGDDVSNIYSHLNTANDLLNLFQDADDQTMTFLRHTFRTYDIMTALCQGRTAIAPTPPLASAPSTPLYPPSPFHPPDNIDPVYGISADLWSILHRLTNLRPLRDQLASLYTSSEHHSPNSSGSHSNNMEAAILRRELESLCSATEKALVEWSPPFPHHMPAHHHALAYRDSALVHLYRAVYLLPTNHPAVASRCRSALENCLAAAASSTNNQKQHGSSKALLWPLFVAACSAGTREDRAFARVAFESIGKRQEMANTKRAWLVVTKTWAVMDGGGLLGGASWAAAAVDVVPMMKEFGSSMSCAVMLW